MRRSSVRFLVSGALLSILPAYAQVARPLGDFDPATRSVSIDKGGPWSVGGRVFFGATPASFADSRANLWTTDGTPVGTRALDVAVLAPGVGFGRLSFFVEPQDPGYGEPRFFAVRVLDADSGETRRLFSGSPGRPLMRPGRTCLYFTSRDGLWRTDGAGLSTRLVHATVEPSDLLVNEDRAFYVSSGTLWTTDGQAPVALGAGVHQLLGFAASTLVTSFGGIVYLAPPPYDRLDPVPGLTSSRTGREVSLGGRLLFAASASSGRAAYSTDGTVAGTIPLTRSGSADTPVLLGAAPSYALFLAAGGLYRTDGTPSRTTRLGDLAVGETVSISRAVVLNDAMIFLAAPLGSSERRMIRSDGTWEGTRVLASRPDGGFADALAAGDGVVFSADAANSTLWRSDGTEVGTKAFFRPRVPSGEPLLFAEAVRGRVVFGTQPMIPAAGPAIRAFDTSGRVAEVAPSGCRTFEGAARVPGLALISTCFSACAPRPNSDCELLATDGTAEGTFSLGATVGLLGSDSRTALTNGYEYDPLTGRTRLDIRAWSGGVRQMRAITPVEEWRGTEDDSISTVGYETGGLWYLRHLDPLVTDGSVEGTRPLKVSFSHVLDAWGTPLLTRRASPTEASGLFRLEESGAISFLAPVHPAANCGLGGRCREVDSWTRMIGRVALTGRDVSMSPPASSGLWFSDGTAEGTYEVRAGVRAHFDVDPLTALGDRVLFAHADPLHGRELWISDGTPAGTMLLTDIAPGLLGSAPAGFTRWRGRVYFTAFDVEHGRELWVTDGTTEGTRLVRDLRPGPLSSSPANLQVAGGRLFLSADDGVIGPEPWVLEPDEAPVRSASIDPPCRLYDSRENKALGHGPILAGRIRPIPVAGVCGVPLDARGVYASVTVISRDATGEIHVSPEGEPPTDRMLFSYLPRGGRSRSSYLDLGDLGNLRFENVSAAGSVDLVVDVSGYLR